MNTWDEKIECIESDGRFFKIQELWESITGQFWYALMKIDENKRTGWMYGTYGYKVMGGWNIRYLKEHGLAKKIKRKDWYMNKHVKMIYESEVCRE